MSEKKGGAEMKITSVANAGLLIEGAGKKILLDAVYGRAPKGFSPIPKEKLEKLTAGQPPFDGITHVLVSHYHWDHYATDTMKLFLEHNDPVLWMIDTYGMPQKLPQTARVELLPPEKDTVFTLDLGDGDRAEAFVIAHSGREFREVDVACFSVHLGGKSILALSDANFDPVYISSMTDGVEYDAVFSNPLFLDIPGGREALFRGINTKEIVICHLPYPEDDVFSMVKMAKKDAELYGPFSRPVTFWEEKDEEIQL